MKVFLPVALAVSSLGKLVVWAEEQAGESKRANLRGESSTSTNEDERELAFGSGSSSSGGSQSIIGGTAAAARTWFVQGNGCGGTLIARDMVLTAAHCWDAVNANSAWPVGGKVYLGNTKLNTVTAGAETNTIKKVFRHPSYNGNTNAWDFMVVQLNTPVSTSRTVATLNPTTANPAAGASLKTMGFGSTVEGGGLSNTFLEVTVKAYTAAQCNVASAYGGDIIDSVMICAGWDTGGRDSCQGDSGGPIVDASNVLVGVVSFGIGCGQAKYPGVYARVSAGKSWIEQIVCTNTLSNPKPSFCPGSTTPKAPTKKPTKAPTKTPTTPAKKPTKAPTKKPVVATKAPTKKPTAKPIARTQAPTKKPTTKAPTRKPATKAPTKKPSAARPTSYPTYADDDDWWNY